MFEGDDKCCPLIDLAFDLDISSKSRYVGLHKVKTNTLAFIFLCSGIDGEVITFYFADIEASAIVSNDQSVNTCIPFGMD